MSLVPRRFSRPPQRSSRAAETVTAHHRKRPRFCGPISRHSEAELEATSEQLCRVFSRSRPPGSLTTGCGLKRQQRLLHGKAAGCGIPAQATPGSYHPMAGDDQRDSVGGHAVSDRPGCSGGSRLGCQLAVGAGFAVRDTATMVDHPALKLGQAPGVHPQVTEIVGRTGGVFNQPANQRGGECAARSGFQKRRVQCAGSSF